MSTARTILSHATKVYARFAVDAAEVDAQFAEQFAVPEGALVYVGYWSNDFGDRNDPKNDGLPGASTQQKAVTFLANAECIEHVRRGARDYASVIRLIRPPVLDDAVEANLDNIQQVQPSKLNNLDAITTALINRVDTLEQQLKYLDAQFGQFNERLGWVETHFPGDMPGTGLAIDDSNLVNP
jgi:hypothetical protein